MRGAPTAAPVTSAIPAGDQPGAFQLRRGREADQVSETAHGHDSEVAKMETANSEADTRPLEPLDTVRLLYGPNNGEKDVISEVLGDDSFKVLSDDGERIYSRAELQYEHS